MSKKSETTADLLSLMQQLQYRKTKAGLYALLTYNERKKSVSTSSNEYYNYISKMYYEETSQFIDEHSIKTRLKIIECDLEFQNNSEDLYTERYVVDNNILRIDMANDQLQYVEIKDENYQILNCDDDNILFCNEPIRKPMDVLPIETAIESLKDNPLDILDTYFNLSEDDLFLLKVWLVASMNPSINTPLLFFLGGAGTGKSSMQKIIGDLLDPSTRGLTNWDDTPLQDLAIMLNRSYVMNFDNVSKITQKKSDLLCQCITGGHKNFRKKYTDCDEMSYNLWTRLTISSVNNCLNRDDLLSRTIFIDVPKMTTKARIREDQFMPLYSQNRAQLTSELLIILSIALNRFDKWEETHQAYNRLAGFEVFGSLIADILDEKDGYDKFIRILRNKYILQAFNDENDLIFIQSMIEVLSEEHDNCYSGSTKVFYDAICNWIIDSPNCDYNITEFMKYDRFAKTLHTKEEVFNNLGYEIKFGRITKENVSKITIKKTM